MTISNVAAFQTYVVLRLCRWRDFERWLANGTTAWPGPRDPKSWWRLILEGNVEQIDIVSTKDVCPVSTQEALETRRCVAALPDHFRELVYEEYVAFGEWEGKCAALAIDKRTYRSRLRTAHNLLLGLFNDAAAGCLE